MTLFLMWSGPRFSETTELDQNVTTLNIVLRPFGGLLVPLCMEEMVMCNAGVVLSPIHPYVMDNTGLVST